MKLGKKVVVDGFNLAMPKGTGVASYARSLTQSLKMLNCDIGILYGMNISRRTSMALREVIFFDSLDGERGPRRVYPLSARWWSNQLSSISGYRAVEIPVMGRVEARGFSSRLPEFNHLWNVTNLYNRASKHFRRTGRFLTVVMPNAPEIMHWTYPLPIQVKGAKNIYTIHDMVPLRLPYTTLDDKGYHYRLLRKIARQSDAICTVSDASRQDIISFFPEAESRVHNTFQSFQTEISRNESVSDEVSREVKALFGLEREGYYLFFGSLEPKKNLGRLIEGFLAADVERPLVIVGAMAWKSDSELRFLEQGIAKKKIIRLEYLPRSALTALISCARGVLFPSLSEGFGLPVLEALALGTPVLTSQEGALPEVAGDAAIYVNAYDAKSITQGIEKMDRDDLEIKRIRGLAPDQVKKFNMEVYCKNISNLYDCVSA